MKSNRVLIAIMAAGLLATLPAKWVRAQSAPPPAEHRDGPPPDDDGGPDDAMDDDGPPGPGPGGPPHRPMRPGAEGIAPGGPGPRMGGPDGMHKPPMFPPTQEEQEALLAFARQHFPEMITRLDALKKDDPQAYKRVSRRMWPRLQIMKEAYERDPQGLGKILIDEKKLEDQIRTKVRAYQQERDSTRKSAVGAELRQLLDQQFDVRLQRRRLELADLQKRLEEQTKRVDSMAAKKQDLVQRQFDRITGEGDPDW